MQFGCLEEISSIRDYDYETVCGASAEELPESYILPDNRLPKVRNQGNISACVAFACVEIIEVLNRIELNSDNTFSAGFFYGYNRPSDQKQEGMFVSSALDCFTKTGSVPVSIYDELEEMPEMYKLVKDRDDLATIAEKYRIKGYYKIDGPQQNTEAVKRALYQNKYPLLASSRSYFGGGHAIIIVGWEPDGYTIQNSWGEEWGNEGRKTIPFEAINKVYVLTDEVFEMKFNDVDKDKWYYDAVKEVVFNGLMQGTSEDTFEPDRAITRAEMAQFGVNLCKKIDALLATKK